MKLSLQPDRDSRRSGELLWSHTVSKVLALFMLIALSVCATSVMQPRRPQVAFLNHCFAVLDQDTADAIERSSYLQRFGVLSVRTTHANGGESWTGRYLTGRKTYLEFFGPKDGGGSAGATGIGLSPDRIGGLAVVIRRLAQEGKSQVDTEQRTRQVGNEQVPWFDAAAPHEDADTLSVWAMELLPSFMNDPRNGKEPAKGPDDVISRDRSLPDDYLQRMMRDVSLVEIATTAHDIALARPMLVASGFAVSETPGRLIASDADTLIILVATTREGAGITRVEFALNASVDRHVEQIGRSTLTVGPGTHAEWKF